MVGRQRVVELVLDSIVTDWCLNLETSTKPSYTRRVALLGDLDAFYLEHSRCGE